MDDDLREEMAFHRSLTSAPAFGNAALALEDARSVWIAPWVESIGQDVRFALRNLRRQPAFAAAALTILGAAIGFNVSLFTVFTALMNRPWPAADPARVVSVFDSAMRSGFSLAELRYFARNSRSFEGWIATRCIDGGSDGCRVALDDRTVAADFVTPNYFDVLGLRLARGAGFQSSAELLGSADAVAVISHAAWTSIYGRDDAIVGRPIRLDDVPFTIVGVAPEGFGGVSVERKDVWIPIGAMPLLRADYIFDDTRREAAIAGRLAAGVSRDRARAELDVLSRQYRIARSQQPTSVRVEPTTFFPNPGRRRMAYPFFALMLAAVLLVLALACANVGNLLFARAVARRREIAVRVSLGAARSRIVRQLVTESLVLAAGAATLGVGVAWILPSWFMTKLAGPTALPLAPDLTVVAYAGGVGLFACLLFGLAPALHGTRGDLGAATKSGGPWLAGTIPLRTVLLAVQVAGSITLLVNAALITRGIERVAAQDPGFAVDGVSVVSVTLPASYDTARRRAFARQLLLRTDHALTPGRAAFTDTAPFARGGREWTTARLPARPARDGDVLIREVSPEFFDVLGIPVIAGRRLTTQDAAGPGVLINESMARRFWPGENAVGRTFLSSGERQVLGVVRDTRMYAGSVTLSWPAMYEPIAGRTIPQLLVRGLDPAAFDAVRSLAVALEPRAHVTAAPLAGNLDRLLDEPRLHAALAGTLGGIALGLAAFGVFSVFAFSVQQRTVELGIRMALGARPLQVIAPIVGSSMHALVAGLAAGFAGAVVSGRLIRSLLFGLSPFDPLSYGTAGVLVVAAGLAAIVHPWFRALRIDPVRALRAE
jgi:predicted permease